MPTAYYAKSYYQPSLERREAGNVTLGGKHSISTLTSGDKVHFGFLPKGAKLVRGWSLILKVLEASTPAATFDLVVKDTASGGTFEKKIITGLKPAETTGSFAFDGTGTYGDVAANVLGWLGYVTTNEFHEVYAEVTASADGAITAGNVEVLGTYTMDTQPGD